MTPCVVVVRIARVTPLILGCARNEHHGAEVYQPKLVNPASQRSRLSTRGGFSLVINSSKALPPASPVGIAYR